ncbi:MAG: IbrB, partial [Rhodocyclaceae bacterium]
DEPISRVVWWEAATLRPNWYNPNHVFKPELDLLERSLLETGWIQPILVHAAERWIIDGFHRWRLSTESARVAAKYRGLLPCVPLDVPVAQAMIITVRINRAKGTHAAVEMSHLVRALIDEHHCDPDEVAVGIGATRAEVDLLYEKDLFVARGINKHEYSRAWVPVETGKGVKGGVVEGPQR